jgi:hypothetical protein
LYTISNLSKLEPVSIIWKNLTSADFKELEYEKMKFENLCHNQSIEQNLFCNYESVLNTARFESLYFSQTF